MSLLPPKSTLFPYTRSSDLARVEVYQRSTRGRYRKLGKSPNLYEYLTGKGFVEVGTLDRKSTRLNSSHVKISYAVFCLKKKKRDIEQTRQPFESAAEDYTES